MIGNGAIGGEIARALAGGGIPGLELVAIMTRGRPAALPAGIAWAGNLEALLALQPELVVEAAGVDALRMAGEAVLKAGADLLLMSAAALADARFDSALRVAAAAGRARILVPSGAIAGLDAVSAACRDGLERVVMTQRKPPAALLPAAEAATLTVPQVLSEGTARDAALKFPRNSNIAAALALAGPGFDRVLVRVVADPAVTRNTVELEAEGAFGCLRLTLENVPSAATPKTSALAALSALACLGRQVPGLVCPA